MKKVILSGIYLFLTMGIIAQTAVLNVKDNESMKDEPVVSYFLPRTVLKIEVEAIKTIKKKGPYAADAYTYFGAPAKIQQDEEIWAINRIRVTQESEPDPANQYKVYASTNSNAVLLTLTETGILKGINIPFSADVKSVICKGDERKEKTEDSALPLFISNFIVKEEDDSQKKPYAAAVAFDQISTLRETRQHILSQSNDVLQDGGAVRAYLTEIGKREEELTALFNGKELKKVVEKTFVVYPDKEMKNQEVFYFSEKQGFSDSGNAIKITLKKKDLGSKSVFSGGGKNGFVYKIPVLADVEITGNDTIFWTGEIIVAQLGRFAYFSAGFFDKNNVRALFDTKSGALLQLGR